MTRAAEAEHGGEDQQGVQVEPGALLVEDAVDPEQPQGDAQDQQNRNVGSNQQKYALHMRGILGRGPGIQ
jgi:hypothetical protein